MTTFVRTDWVNDSAPDITAEQLDRIEQGIVDAHTKADAAVASADVAFAAAGSSVASLNLHATDYNNPHHVTAKQVGARHHKNAVQRGALGNDSTDNTVILQALLDEIRDAGGGELYLPGDGTKVYRTKGLWVPSNCRIVSEGAELKFTAQSPFDRGAGGGDIYYGDGCLNFTRQYQTGPIPTGLTVEGITINSIFTYYLSYAPMGISANGENIRIRDVTVKGLIEDAIYIGGYRSGRGWAEYVWVEDCKLLAAQRNVISIVGGKYVWIERNRITGCTGSSPTDPGNYIPGCGIDIEPNGVGDPVSRIVIRGNVIDTNAGAGIACVFSAAAGGGNLSDCDRNLIEGNVVEFNGQGSTNGKNITTDSGVWIAGGQTNGDAALRVVGNSLRFQSTGAGFKAAATNVHVMLLDNDLRSNGSPNTPVSNGGVGSGSRGFGYSGGSYDDGDNLRYS